MVIFLCLFYLFIYLGARGLSYNSEPNQIRNSQMASLSSNPPPPATWAHDPGQYDTCHIMVTCSSVCLPSHYISFVCSVCIVRFEDRSIFNHSSSTFLAKIPRNTSWENWFECPAFERTRETEIWCGIRRLSDVFTLCNIKFHCLQLRE